LIAVAAPRWYRGATTSQAAGALSAPGGCHWGTRVWSSGRPHGVGRRGPRRELPSATGTSVPADDAGGRVDATTSSVRYPEPRRTSTATSGLPAPSVRGAIAPRRTLLPRVRARVRRRLDRLPVRFPHEVMRTAIEAWGGEDAWRVEVHRPDAALDDSVSTQAHARRAHRRTGRSGSFEVAVRTRIVTSSGERGQSPHQGYSSSRRRSRWPNQPALAGGAVPRPVHSDPDRA
jgi:hypothetical protein